MGEVNSSYWPTTTQEPRAGHDIERPAASRTALPNGLSEMTWTGENPSALHVIVNNTSDVSESCDVPRSVHEAISGHWMAMTRALR